MRKIQTLGLLITLVGLALVVLSVWRCQVESQVIIIAWYDLNGDGKIDLHDFDVNNDGAVTYVDVQMTINAKQGAYDSKYDFNRDGVIDDLDVQIVQAWMGRGVMALYDMNGDGMVDWHDLDVNDDGEVDVCDIVTVAQAYGSKIGEPNYNPRVDFNQDGSIDDADINLIRPYFGYPLTITDLVNPALPVGQMFLLGLVTCTLGITVMWEGRKY